LVAAVVAGDLATTLKSAGPFTVFAPTNDAFSALPAGTVDSLLKPENKAQLVDILTYHVLPSQVLSTDLKTFQRVKTVEGKHLDVFATKKGVFVGSDKKNLKQVTGADNLATNGVAHIINGVMLPPAKLEAKPTVDLVDLASSVPALSTLVAAVVAGDLATTLKSAGPFTVFAPTNDAFSALPAGTVDSLLKPENKAQLVDILTYHVLPSQVLLRIDGEQPFRWKTVEGKNLDVFKSVCGGWEVGPNCLTEGNCVHVTGANNLATNGVAHIINGVMLPLPDPPTGASEIQV